MREKFSTDKQPSRQLQTGLTVKVYLRNFGKGTLEHENGYLRFYVETGRFTKRKELANEIPLIEVENVSLDENELNVDWKNSTQRFVFENTSQAKTIFENTKKYFPKKDRTGWF